LYVPVVKVPAHVVIAFAALQLAGVPPPVAEHVHVHGPVPPTADGEPVLQRLVVGATDTVVPLAVPHTPLTAAAVTMKLLVTFSVLLLALSNASMRIVYVCPTVVKLAISADVQVSVRVVPLAPAAEVFLLAGLYGALPPALER